MILREAGRLQAGSVLLNDILPESTVFYVIG